MKLLLLILNNYRLAINMEYVSRIIDTEKKKSQKKKLLFSLGKAKIGVLLKNNYIVPAQEVEEITSYSKEIISPGQFLEGYLKNGLIEGFIIINGKIYSLLSKVFLKIDDKLGVKDGDI